MSLMPTDEEPTTRRGRGRPPKALLSREQIASRALAIGGREGFGAVSMHRLADEFGVTARALYNHVPDRQSVIDDAAILLLRGIPDTPLDVADWRSSIRRLYAEARTYYRSFPRAVLISLDEEVTLAGVDPARIRLAERNLEFFTGIGLTLRQAMVVRSAFLTEVAGFVLLVDDRSDQADDATRDLMSRPVPPPWLDANPELAAPLSRQAALGPPMTSDEHFTDLVDLRIAGIERWLERNAAATDTRS